MAQIASYCSDSPLDPGTVSNSTQPVEHEWNRRSLLEFKGASKAQNKNSHFNIQFDAPPDMVELSHPPMQPLPTTAYVNDVQGSGKGVTIYTFDSGVNTESDVNTFHPHQVGVANKIDRIITA